MFRNYKNNNIQQFYKNLITEQTYARKLEFDKILKYNKPIYLADAIYYLNKVIDSSDPDTTESQIYHGYQTAEFIKKTYFTQDKFNKIHIKDLFTNEEYKQLPMKYQLLFNTTIDSLYNHINDWSWLQIIGLIHDLGKVLVLPEFGYFPEFFSVGDIYPLGCKFQESNIYYEKQYHTQCPDFLNTQFNTLNGIYKPNCGFDNVAMTFSHDYYLYNILLKSCTKLPVEALYIIRYHSFYGWHTPHNKIRGYTNLANNKDWLNLPLLKLFQKTDLYSKHNSLPNISVLEEYYNTLIKKYLLEILMF